MVVSVRKRRARVFHHSFKLRAPERRASAIQVKKILGLSFDNEIESVGAVFKFKSLELDGKYPPKLTKPNYFF